MAKRVDPLKAKQAKQKKMAIGLCVVFAAVLAFQGPKTLKMLKGPQAETAPVAAPATAAPVADPNTAPAPAPVAGAPVAAGAVPPGVGDAQPAVLVDSDLPAAPADGQLRSFELFQTKDPFVQQGEVTTLPGSPSSPSTKAPEITITTPSLATGGTVVVPPAGSTGSSSGSAPTATPGTTAGTPPAAPAAATSISVNDLAEDVAPGVSFPAAAPVFVLVSLAEDGKSVQIGIAGGAYADGAETIKLTLGKPLTLRNTADGSQFVLLLNTVAGFVPPPPKKK